MEVGGGVGATLKSPGPQKELDRTFHRAKAGRDVVVAVVRGAVKDEISASYWDPGAWLQWRQDLSTQRKEKKEKERKKWNSHFTQKKINVYSCRSR